MKTTELLKRVPVPGQPGYLVAADGSFWSWWTPGKYGGITRLVPRRNKPHVNEHGQVQARFRDRTLIALGHVVLEAFGHARPSPDHLCLHKDGDPANCRLDNLCWALPRDVMKWTPLPVVADVKQKYATGLWTQRELAAKHLLGLTTVARIVREAGLKNVPKVRALKSDDRSPLAW